MIRKLKNTSIDNTQGENVFPFLFQRVLSIQFKMLIRNRRGYRFIFVGLIFLLSGACATYYQKNLVYQEHISKAEFAKAKEILEKDKKGKEGKNRLLYYFNSGWIDWITSNPIESNKALETADNIIEDQQKNYGLEALALMTNANIKPYVPEDFETVFVNYYKALNYLNLNQYDEARVESRKINIKLNRLNDKYKDYKNRYQRDAFAEMMSGFIYDANKEYNDAFISYRNALEIYENDYVKNFNVQVPQQLKWDILRTAKLTGFSDEVDFYEKKFNIKYSSTTNDGGDLIFIWNNGFGPVKAEWSLNFTKVNGDVGFVTFADEESGLTLPFFIGDKPANEQNAFSQLSFVRVAFPKYLERKPYYDQAELSVNGEKHPLELAENVNEIAFKTLRDRMVREMANSLLRLATKKAMEAAARDQNQDFGTVVGIANALTEKADTRNWQTLPYSVSYTRVSLPAGEQNIELKVFAGGTSRVYNFNVNIVKGKTSFLTFSNIESLPPQEKQ